MRILAADPAALDVPAYLANGVIGLRPQTLPLTGWATLSGYAGISPERPVQSLCQAPYPLALDVGWQGYRLSKRPQAGEPTALALDLASGELTTTFRIRAGDALLTVTQVAFCSRVLPTLAVQEVTVTADRPCQVSLWVGIDGSTAQGTCVHRDNGEYEGQRVVDGAVRWAAPGGLASAGLAYAAQGADGAHGRREDGAAGGLVTRFDFDLVANVPASVHQVTSCIPSVMHSEPDRQAVRMAYLGIGRGLARLRAENRAAWAELWRGRPVLQGAPSRWQDLADASFHHLHSAAHAATPAGTSLFGLGHWPGYACFNGHVFWDIETYSVPPLALTAPDAARALLGYRGRHREAAARNALMNGYRGLQYPWESSPLGGEEVTPSGWPIIIHEQHITLDVAYAMAQSAHAFADDDWTRDTVWPVLSGVAEWIVSRVVRTARGCEIRDSMGICEGEITDNNAFVAAAAIVVLTEAAALATRLGRTPPRAWRAVAEAIVVPRAGDLVLRSDGYDLAARSNATETLAAFYPYSWRQSPAVEAATTRHYLVDKGTAALGWPMLPALFAVHAARLGDRALTGEMMERGTADYALQPFLMMDEFGCGHTATKPKVGPYLAHIGAFVQNLIIGLPGLQFGPESPTAWGRFPITLPPGWDGIEIERLWLHGRPWRLSARQGQGRATLTALDEAFTSAR